MSPRIYIASKTRHAARWRELRDAGLPIISTWIDDPVDKEPGGAVDHVDLWDRCVREASTATALVAYVGSPHEVLKGAFVEVGAALARGVPVFLVGDPDGTCWHHRLVQRCRNVEDAFERALLVPGPIDVEISNVGDPGRWTYLALVVGFNELVKMSKTLGERLFLRMARDRAWGDYRDLGGKLDEIPSDGDAVVLAIQDKMPEVVFRERDVELMRAAVAEYDSKEKR